MVPIAGRIAYRMPRLLETEEEKMGKFVWAAPFAGILKRPGRLVVSYSGFEKDVNQLCESCKHSLAFPFFPSLYLQRNRKKEKN